jgi:hypothetical protein
MLQIWKGSWAGPILLRDVDWGGGLSSNDNYSLLDEKYIQCQSAYGVRSNIRCFMAQTVGQLGESRKFELRDLNFLKRDIRILKSGRRFAP